MMSKLVQNMMIRVIKSKVDQGEDLEVVLKRYPKLTDNDKVIIRNALK